MLRTGATVLLAGAALLIGTEVVIGQQIIVIPQTPIKPAGAQLWNYNAEGTFTMGAASNVSKITVTLQVKKADGVWYDVQIEKPAVFQVAVPVPGAPAETGSYSITISDARDIRFEYQMKAFLYKKKPNGTLDPVAVTTSTWAAVPR